MAENRFDDGRVKSVIGFLRGCLLMLGVLTLIAPATDAHDVRPAYLEIVETQPSVFDVTWKQPMRDGRRLNIDPVFPADCQRSGDQVQRVGSALIERWQLRCDLRSGMITIMGPDQARADAFVRLSRLDREERTGLLRPTSPQLDLAEASGAPVAAYLWIGVEHILFGWDHLLFVVGIVLLVERRQLISTITAFTIAHSITLALSTLAGLSLPGPPVEIVIALSISLLGVEAVYRQRGVRTLGQAMPWVIAFGFGLIHGFGFAGALSEIGLPRGTEASSLLLFNVGVEVGQLAVIAGLLLAGWLITRLRTEALPAVQMVGAYVIGTAGMYWAIERAVALWL